jgi:hypothetical protein
MDITDEQKLSRGGINNYYYGGVTNVINLKLSREQVAVLGSGNNIAETINSLINPHIDAGHGKR